MKFYLTKSAQLAAEGRSKPEKATNAKPLKVAKTIRMQATPVVAQQEEPAPFVADAVASTTPLTATKSKSLVTTKRERTEPKGTVTKRSRGVIAIGGQPRVDLLPPEVRAERRGGQTVRRAWLGVAAVVVLVGVAGGGATVYAQNATSELTGAQAETTGLADQATKYSAVKTTQSKVDLVDAARLVGGGTDIDWGQYLQKLSSTVPNGATLSGVTVDSASPVVAYAQASAPLQGQRVATVTLTATSPALLPVPSWLNNIAKLPAYEDATADTVSLKDGVYTTVVTVHVNKKAFSGLYSKGN